MNLRLTISSMLLTTLSILAQTNETLSGYASIGYGFGSGGQLFSSTTLKTQALQGQLYDVDTITRKDHYLNYGQGMKIDLGIQYFMMENVALQVGFSFSPGVPNLKTEFRNDYLIAGNTSFLDSTVAYHHNMFGVKAMVVPRFEILELLNMHTGVGIGFYWNTLSYEMTRITQDTTQTEKGSIQSAPSLGFNGLIGADYPISDLLSLFGEVGLDMTSFRWTKQKIKDTQFNRSTGSYNFEKNTPNQRPPFRVSGSNWRLSVGVRYAFK
jgi:opacity protein-like surface antigen